MTIFLTSSPTGPLDHSRPVHGIDRKNNLRDNLKRYWTENARCILISAEPAKPDFNDRIANDIRYLLEESGFSCGTMDVWDDRTVELPPIQVNNYDVIILGGGHVPTQNAFLHRISLRGRLKEFRGIVIGISAGTMNCADVVYAQPELSGEATDPHYARFLPGLGLTDINVLPHYQMVKDWELDGLRLYEDITYNDSVGREFLVLPDGSYVLVEEGRASVWGEAFRLSDRNFCQICCDGMTQEIAAFGRMLGDCL